ncbi:MAG TPA: 2'-5' RNA ligase family protein [Steroidobacteraceae bacterium]|nr:2'-5' RNA ligase family protein [Steroidobacteraceae bacterium]
MQEPTQRLFFALWPTGPQQRQMTEATRARVSAAGGRPVPERDLHVTLAFLGSVPQRRVRELAGIAAQAARHARNNPAAGGAVANECAESAEHVRTAPVRLTFARTEYWRKAQILCAVGDPIEASVVAGDASGRISPGSSADDAAMLRAAALAAELQRGLSAAGFSPDLKPFRAHVTLARKVHLAQADAAFAAVTWSFSELALIDSRTEAGGSSYSVVDRWALCADSAPKR